MEPYFVDLAGTGPLSVRGRLKGVTFLRGAQGQAKCHRLTGIPYGLPPVGDLRWRRPLPLPQGHQYGTKDQPLDCSNFPPACAQLQCPEFLAPLVSGDPKNGFSEACLNLNMWIPAGEPPSEGWPVYFYLHGGFLQFGDANLDPARDPSDLLSDTDVRCIIVMPLYRLGLFGFLASSELEQEAQSAGFKSGNYGLWDQRLALEWTHTNISGFGGNPRNIAVGGYSGGSYAAFLQLQYDLARPDEDQIVRRVVLQSNGPGVQPMSLESAQEQFDRVLGLCEIDIHLSPNEKLKKLRELHDRTLVTQLSKKQNMDLVFRPILDNEFAQASLCQIHNGSLASLALERGINFMMGATQNEENFYGLSRVVSYEDMLSRLSRNFPLRAVKAILPHYGVSETSNNDTDWTRSHGQIFADLQVHVPTRGLLLSLLEAGVPLSSISRYEIQWRVNSTFLILPESLGVTHGTDMFFIWFYNAQCGLSTDEKAIVRAWLKPFAAFVRGDDNFDWGTREITDVRILGSDGNVRVGRDERWDQALSIWDTIGRESERVSEKLGSPGSSALNCTC